MNFNNSHESYNALTSTYGRFSTASLGLTVTQPLLRGFGPSLNRRYIRIAANERRISSLLFRQQVILTVYGIVRLYTDFVALSEDVKVKEEAATLAAKLVEDVKAQVEEGTLAQVEMTRANAQVYATRQDLINSRGLLAEQEAILKNQLTRTGNADPDVASAHIIPTDTLTIPAQDEIRPMQDLINEALANRPDLGQARLQIDNSRIGLAGSRNATLPEVDLVESRRIAVWGACLRRFCPRAITRSWAAMAPRSTRCWRATIPPTASVSRSRCPFATASRMPTWRVTKSR